VITRKSLPLGLIVLLCISLLPISPSAAQTTASPISDYPSFNCYRDASSLTAKIHYLAETYPYLSDLVEIGVSVEKRAIYSLEISNEDNLDKPHFILLAGLHGNDFSQPEVALQLAERLLQGYDTDADLQWIVDNIELDLILLANPDGRQVAEAQAALPFAGPSEVLSIKNGSNIDLESNFCVTHPLGQGCDPSKYEPETQAIRTYLNEKLGTPDPTQTPNEQTRDLFVYFSSHSKSTPFAIGNIRIPWFYKANPSELTEPSLSRQNELAKMLKVLDPDLKGSIEPKINGDLFSNYPVDYVFRSYGIASLDLSIYPTLDNHPVDCDKFTNNHPENYLTALLKMAKSATQPYKIGYGPIVEHITKVEETTTQVKYRAEILDKNQILDQPEKNPITSVHYYIDQPTGTTSGELTGWEEIDDNPYTSGLDFSIPTAGLAPGKHILTLQACSQDEVNNPNGECGLPLSAYLIIPDPQYPGDPDPTDTPDDPDPDDPDPTEPPDDLDPPDPDDPDPPGPGSNTIYLPLIGR